MLGNFRFGLLCNQKSSDCLLWSVRGFTGWEFPPASGRSFQSLWQEIRMTGLNIYYALANPWGGVPKWWSGREAEETIFSPMRDGSVGLRWLFAPRHPWTDCQAFLSRDQSLSRCQLWDLVTWSPAVRIHLTHGPQLRWFTYPGAISWSPAMRIYLSRSYLIIPSHEDLPILEQFHGPQPWGFTYLGAFSWSSAVRICLS